MWGCWVGGISVVPYIDILPGHSGIVEVHHGCVHQSVIQPVRIFCLLQLPMIEATEETKAWREIQDNNKNSDGG